MTKSPSNVSLARRFDSDMIREFIQSRGLSMEQVGAPLTHRAGARAIQVDAYAWGQICYATNGEGDHVTWAEHGNAVPAIPLWARDIRSRARPRCLGHHEPDHICDGGDSPDGVVEPLCAWRERCLYAKAFAGHHDRPIADVLAEMSDEALLEGAAVRIQQDAHPRQRDIEGAPFHVQRPPLTVAAQSGDNVRQKPRKPRSLLPKPVRATGLAPEQAASHALAMRLIQMVSLRGEWPVARDKYRAVVGNLLVSDKSVSSKYINVYIKQGPASKDIKVVFAVWIRKLGAMTTINVQIHSGATDKIKAMLPHFDVAAWVDGGATRQCTTIKAVVEDHVALVSDVIVRAVNEGMVNRVQL